MRDPVIRNFLLFISADSYRDASIITATQLARNEVFTRTDVSGWPQL